MESTIDNMLKSSEYIVGVNRKEGKPYIMFRNISTNKHDFWNISEEDYISTLKGDLSLVASVFDKIDLPNVKLYLTATVNYESVMAMYGFSTELKSMQSMIIDGHPVSDIIFPDNEYYHFIANLPEHIASARRQLTARKKMH